MARLCMDIYESNANAFIGEMRTKLSKIQSARANAKEGGDFAHTLSRNAGVINAAIMAAETYHQNALRTDRAADQQPKETR